MKRITIRRNRKQPETKPEPVQQDEDESSETSEFESDDTDTKSEPLTSQLRNLNVREQAHPRQNRQSFQAHEESRRANLVARQSFPAPPVQKNSYQVHESRPKFGAPRSMVYDRPRKQSNGRQKWRYRSIYGPNSHLLSTQEKARRLYYSAFG